MTATNTYIAQPADQIKVPIVRQISKFVFHIMKCFGVYEENDFPNIAGAGDEGAQTSYEDTITPVVNALVKFRDQIKQNANEGPKSLLQICDELRDQVLPYLGIQLEDKGKDASIWKLEDKEILIGKLKSKEEEKLRKEQEKAARAALELKKKSTPGKEWFREFETEKYSKFDDETGLPTHDASGKALSEAIVNGLKKVQNK